MPTSNKPDHTQFWAVAQGIENEIQKNPSARHLKIAREHLDIIVDHSKWLEEYITKARKKAANARKYSTGKPRDPNPSDYVILKRMYRQALKADIHLKWKDFTKTPAAVEFINGRTLDQMKVK